FSYRHRPQRSARHTLSLHDALPIFIVGQAPGEIGHRVGVRLPRIRAAAEAAAKILNLPEKIRFGKSNDGRILRASLPRREMTRTDRKSTRLNSSHSQISYAVFCLKK